MVAELLVHAHASAGGAYRVTLADRSAELLGAIPAYPRLTALQPDVADPDALRRALEGRFAVLSAAPYHLTVQVAEAARGRRALPRPDRGRGCRAASARSPTAPQRLPSSAVRPGAGLHRHRRGGSGAPVRHARQRAHTRRRAAGYPSNALNYNLTWSTDGVISEYCEPCEAIVGGQLRECRRSRSGRSSRSTACSTRFQHLGRAGTLAETLSGKVRTLNYRTIRYPGHAAIMKALLNDLRLRDRREVLKDILEQAVPATLQDVVVIFVTVAGWKDGRLHHRTPTCARSTPAAAHLPRDAARSRSRRQSSLAAMLDLLAAGPAAACRFRCARRAAWRSAVPRQSLAAGVPEEALARAA